MCMKYLECLLSSKNTSQCFNLKQCSDHNLAGSAEKIIETNGNDANIFFRKNSKEIININENHTVIIFLKLNQKNQLFVFTNTHAVCFLLQCLGLCRHNM